MQITQQITMHLDRRQESQIVDAVQGETARAVTLALYDKDQPWTVPADASILIRYRKPDCTGGIYDSLPDGSRAWDFQENLVTVRIAPQALAMAGVIAMQIAIVAQGEELASFIFRLRVEADPSVGTLASDDYINIGQWLMPRIYQFVSDAQAAAALATQAADEARRTAAGVSSQYNLAYDTCCIDPVTGLPADNACAIVSDHFPLLNKLLGVAFSPLVTVRLFFYDSTLAYLGADLMRTEFFEMDAPAGAAFARIEVRYASGMVVANPYDLASYVTVYIPNTSAQDADRAENAASQAFISADRANTAAQAAELASKSSVKTVNGVAPDENGNVTVAGDGADLQYLQIVRRKLRGYDLLALYNGKAFKEAEIPLAFSCIEPSEYNGLSSILQNHLENMPAMLCGTFRATDTAEEEYTFDYAYAFSGIGEANAAIVLDPKAGKLWHFVFAGGSYTVKTSAIGESSGGTSQWALAQTISLAENVESVKITLPTDRAYSEVCVRLNVTVTDANSTVATGGAKATVWLNTTALFTEIALFEKNVNDCALYLQPMGGNLDCTWTRYYGTNGVAVKYHNLASKNIASICLAMRESGFFLKAGGTVEVYVR